MTIGGLGNERCIINLFCWDIFVRAIEKGRFEAAFYLLPFVFMMETVWSPHLNLKMRLDFLSFAFSIFRFHYKQYKKVPANSLFQQRYQSSCLGILFADSVYLKRMMNSIISIAIKLFLNQLCLQRLGSHDLELFYGHMRMMSFNDHVLPLELC